MSFLLHLWQSFLALHPWGYVVTVLFALAAFLKRKAMGAATATAWNKSQEWFWGKVRKNVLQDSSVTHPAEPRQIQEKTYRGQFYGIVQAENYPNDWYFTLRGDGMTTKVPVYQTNLLGGVAHGEQVEIDTQVLIGLRLEPVKRVRIVDG